MLPSPPQKNLFSKRDNWAYLYIYYISKILGGVVFSLSAPKRWFIFYNSFSLRLAENLHERNSSAKHDLHVLFISFLKL